MDLKFVLCDNNTVFLATIERQIEEVMHSYGVKTNIIKFNDYGIEFSNYIKTNRSVVVYILNIEMPTDNGFMAAKMIRKNDKKSIIIFLSSNLESALNLFKARINALTFINKLDYKEALNDSLKEILDYDLGEQYILLNDGAVSYKILMNDIIYLTKEDRRTKIVTNDRTFYTYQSLVNIKKKLGTNFIQCHRACIVNKSRIIITDYVNKIITFDNGLRIDIISEKYKKDFYV